jgi:putative ABC transport system ATP-binding protein
MVAGYVRRGAHKGVTVTNPPFGRCRRIMMRLATDARRGIATNGAGMTTDTIAPLSSVLSATGLTKRYGGTVALADVDLTVAAGESIAVTGPSGSGKSTLLYCLAGVIRPDLGAVVLDGLRLDDLADRRRTRLRLRRFGFVFQFGGLLPELPAEENVALPLILAGVTRRRAVAQARRWFAPLGIDGLEHRRPGQLSSGQAQRVAIARALVTDPAVVFADEPTGSLDSTTGADVMTLLTAVTRHQRAALVVVTHDPRVAASCDRHVAIRDGRLEPVPLEAR